MLVVAERSDELTWKSLRNIDGVHLLDPGQLNTYDVLVSDDVVFTDGSRPTWPAPAIRARKSASDREHRRRSIERSSRHAS